MGRFMYAERWRKCKFKDNQRKEISIRNIKLSECTSRNRCIHSRIDVRDMSVKGTLVRIKMSHSPLKRGQLFLMRSR